MAEQHKHVTVVGLHDKLIVGKLEVDRSGTVLSAADTKKVQEAAKASGVQLSVSDAPASEQGSTETGRN